MAFVHIWLIKLCAKDDDGEQRTLRLGGEGLFILIGFGKSCISRYCRIDDGGQIVYGPQYEFTRLNPEYLVQIQIPTLVPDSFEQLLISRWTRVRWMIYWTLANTQQKWCPSTIFHIFPLHIFTSFLIVSSPCHPDLTPRFLRGKTSLAWRRFLELARWPGFSLGVTHHHYNGDEVYSIWVTQRNIQRLPPQSPGNNSQSPPIFMSELNNSFYLFSHYTLCPTGHVIEKL